MRRSGGLLAFAAFLIMSTAFAEDEASKPLDADTVALFADVEPVVERAPDSAETVSLLAGQTVLDIAVSPVAADAFVLMQNSKGERTLLRWKLGRTAGRVAVLPLPGGAPITGLTWHPRGTAVFAIADKAILKLDAATEQWQPRGLWRSPTPLERIVAGPRPFGSHYRLFFTQRKADGTRAIASVTETGTGFYSVTAAHPKPPKDESEPNTEAVADARLITFHPAGHVMLWADARGCFSSKSYDSLNWKPDSDRFDEACGGSLAFTPNGAALIRWQAGRPGVELVDRIAKTRRTLAADVTFVTAPVLTPDGRGLMGATAQELRYLPLDLPIADVANAWMFLEAPEDQPLFAANGGLFRPIKDDEQLYKLYESEMYNCGGYDDTRPTRPYLVTTDIFWEVFAAAYQGIFVTVERERAMPAFARLVDAAAAELAKRASGSRMSRVFAAVRAVMVGRSADNDEAARIVAGTDRLVSPVVGEEVDYSVFRPRGHYVRDDRSRSYFQAVRYLSALELAEEDIAALAVLSPETRELARAWTEAYRSFIAPSRAGQGWTGAAAEAGYASRPADKPRLFPLSWGWDNEVLDNAMHHADHPLEGPKGKRMLPMGLDLPMALGNPIARNVLAELGQFADYPALERYLTETGRRFAERVSADGDSLYARWIRALAAQWTAAPDAPVAKELWNTKRLQTGLASWATLRHATVLVNEVAMAECGEGGFEAIRMRPPHGYVEPDPAAFAAIASLFDAASAHVRRMWPAGDPLAEGLLRRLAQSRDATSHFGAMAAKEAKGEPLTPQDYADIHYVGRVAEHNFLVFHSLDVSENALSNPDPVMKVAEVAGSARDGWLEAAVGRPLEWDVAVPSSGRRDIVKGAVYAYHEFVSAQPVNDVQWREKVDAAPRPSWIQRYVSPAAVSCSPKIP